MRPTSILAGASRLPLTPKRGNKDFYKGTGQSRVPGGGHRTGPPGVHVIRGKAKYRLLDEKVRVFVGPGEGLFERQDLKPYVATRQDLDGGKTRFFNPFSRTSSDRPSLPSFSPNVIPHPSSSSSSSSEMEGSSSRGTPKLTRKDFTSFSKRYQALSEREKQALIMNSRREWWNEMTRLYGPEQSTSTPINAQEEERTKDVEDRAEEQRQTSV